MNALSAFQPRPSLVVQSGTGENVHAYWSLTEPLSVGWVERANRRLAHRLGADMKSSDAARILRPPASLNWKHDPPVRVTANSFRDMRMSVASVVQNLADPPSKSPGEPRDTAHTDDPLDGISANRYYTVLTGRPVTGGNVQCPFHSGGQERNPSMRLYDTTFFCFGCDTGGSVYEFGAALWGLDTRGADFVRLRERLTNAI